VGYAVFAMAPGICVGALLRRTVPAIAVTLAGFVALRVLTSWLRLYYMTPVTAYYKLTANWPASGSFLQISQGVVGPDGQPPTAGPGTVMAGPGQLRAAVPDWASRSAGGTEDWLRVAASVQGVPGGVTGAWMVTVPALQNIRVSGTSRVASYGVRGSRTRPTTPDLGSYAARSYSLMRPPRAARRWIRSLERSAIG
jgi:hypothetical protein